MDEKQVEQLIKALPRSVVDVNDDGTIAIHEVDMVQAQMDQVKALKAARDKAVKFSQMLKECFEIFNMLEVELNPDLPLSEQHSAFAHLFPKEEVAE